ncbi:hypothetical protein [Streptomyces hydrogenans]|uniref:hypothetical protein n=1 Tax=Streptomyces hydrogenans TaxID=1873719 RepID=UPI0035D8F454
MHDRHHPGCTCADAEPPFAPVHHYKDCPQYAAPVVLSPSAVACLRGSWSMAGGAFTQQAEALRVHPCPHPDTWFDRSVGAEPCGSMHDRCTDCGVVVGHPRPSTSTSSATRRRAYRTPATTQDAKALASKIHF